MPLLISISGTTFNFSGKILLKQRFIKYVLVNTVIGRSEVHFKIKNLGALPSISIVSSMDCFDPTSVYNIFFQRRKLDVMHSSDNAS